MMAPTIQCLRRQNTLIASACCYKVVSCIFLNQSTIADAILSLKC